MGDDAPTLEQLRAEVARLRSELTALREQLVAASRQGTMRAAQRCPACGCGRIAHAFSVLDRGDDDRRAVMALYQASWWASDLVGELEAYACTACGLLEWYVKEPASLREHTEFMRILDSGGPGKAGPYR